MLIIPAPTLSSVNFTATSSGIRASWNATDVCSFCDVYYITAYSTTDPNVTTTVCGECASLMDGVNIIPYHEFSACHSYTFEMTVYYSEGGPITSNRTEYSLSPSALKGKTDFRIT